MARDTRAEQRGYTACQIDARMPQLGTQRSMMALEALLNAMPGENSPCLDGANKARSIANRLLKQAQEFGAAVQPMR